MITRYRPLASDPAAPMKVSNTVAPGDASTRYVSLRRRVLVLGILVLVGFSGSFFYSLWRTHQRTIEATDVMLANLARALSEQTAWTWQAIDLLLLDTARWYATDGRGHPKELIDRALAERAAGVRQVRDLNISDATGRQRFRSDGRLIAGLDVSDRSYFVTQREGAAGLYISEPMLTHSGKKSIVVLSRRIEDAQGGFLGVVTATVDLQDLKDLYGAVKLDSGSSISLLRSDRTLLVRNPPAPELVGRKWPLSMAPADEMPVRIRSPIDGSHVFVAIAPVRDAPLVLTLTRQEDVALRSWRDDAVGAVVRTLGMTLLGALTVIALIRQIHRVEAAERALLASRERQAQSQKLEALGSLAGGIAHDFNNILGAILGYGELAQQHSPPASTVRRYVDNVMHAAERAKTLVDRILSFSRGGLSERAPLHAQAVVEETLELLEPSLPKEIRLEKNLTAGDAAVIGDPTQLHQVTMNLCTNAVQAMPSGGTLQIALECTVVSVARSVTRGMVSPGRYLLLTASDTGGGIPAAAIDRVFDPFFTTKAVGEGTGLGLSVVDGIVHDLGGAIDVTTRPGGGTVFCIWLPAAGEIARPRDQGSAELVYGNGETVMIVDDERMLVTLAEEMLARLGYEPVGYDSSAAALEAFALAPQRFDVVLTDENMPGLTGTELTRELRKVRVDIPVLLMSGYGGAQLAERAAAAGVLELLRKPLQQRDLSDALARILSKLEAVSNR